MKKALCALFALPFLVGCPEERIERGQKPTAAEQETVVVGKQEQTKYIISGKIIGVGSGPDANWGYTTLYLDSGRCANKNFASFEQAYFNARAEAAKHRGELTTIVGPYLDANNCVMLTEIYFGDQAKFHLCPKETEELEGKLVDGQGVEVPEFCIDYEAISPEATTFSE